MDCRLAGCGRSLFQGVERLTRVATGQPRHLPLTNPHLFEYPWIDATQTGWWGLTTAEIERLREYLPRGGFLMVNEMWGPGPEQWEVFTETMSGVFPDKSIGDVEEKDAAMHVLYDIQSKDLSFIPRARHLRRGVGGTVEVQQSYGTRPAWRPIYDGKNRMIVSVNFKYRHRGCLGVSGAHDGAGVSVRY